MTIIQKTFLTFALSILVILAGIGASYRVYPPLPTPAPVVRKVPEPVQPDKLAALVMAVNIQREAYSETDLIEDPRLDQSANNKCQDMLTRHYFNHDSPTGEAWTRFMPLPYSKAGENLSEGYSYLAVTQAWMNSPEHKQNILDPAFHHVGYAVCGSYIVQHFEN